MDLFTTLSNYFNGLPWHRVYGVSMDLPFQRIDL